MAVENKYVNADLVAGKNGTAALVAGDKGVIAVATFEVAAADDDGSIYRVFKNVNPHLIPVDFMIFNDALTGSTDWDLGLYEPLVDGAGGAVIVKDCFLNGGDLSSAHARGSELDGLSAVDLANIGKRLYEIATHTLSTRKRGYDIAFTANTIGSGAGTVSIVAIFVQG